MNSKERVIRAIKGEVVDEIPLGFYAVDSDTVEKVIGHETYVRDKVGRRLAFWEGRRDEVVESYKKDTVEFFEKIDCVDILTLKEAAFVPPEDYEPKSPQEIDDGVWKDDAGRIYKKSEISNEIICVEDPTEKSFKDYSPDDFPVPEEEGLTPPDPSIFEASDYLIEEFTDEKYIAGKSGGLAAFPLIGGMKTGLMLYGAKPEVIRSANHCAVKKKNYLDQYYIRPGQDGVLFEQDMAGTDGPFISPKKFEKNCLPYLKERVRNVKGFDQQVLLHNCGDNRPLMEMFINAGVQAYQSLQPNAGMNLKHLQDKYGSDMTFWGGVDVELLIEGSMKQVREEVRNALVEGAKKPGFILGPSHSIAYGTNYDNFMAMIDEYQKMAGKAV